jgi:hypothetical protein
MTTRTLMHRLALDAVKAVLGWLIVLLVLEAALPGFVSRFFNLTWLLLAAFVLAVLAFATHEAGESTRDESHGGVMFILLLGAAAAAYAWIALPPSLSSAWRILAAGAILLLALFLPMAFSSTRK